MARASSVLNPRSKEGMRPTCETVMPAPYFKRAYAARDAMHFEIKWGGDVHPVGHLEGCYCLDRPEPASGSHVAWDFVYRSEG